MSKLFLFLSVVIIAGLIYFGVIEITVRIPGVPDVSTSATETVKQKTSYETGRAYVVGLKRKGEHLFIRDKEKRLIIALLYVKNDAQRLQEMLDNNASSDSLIPQADLLLESINQVKSNAEKAPAQVVASLKEDSREAFGDAATALSGLREQSEEYSKINEDFDRLTSSLETQIGALGIDKSEEKVENNKNENQSGEEEAGEQKLSEEDLLADTINDEESENSE